MHVGGWWGKSSHVVMEAWDEYTSMRVVKVIYSMVKSYNSCLVTIPSYIFESSTRLLLSMQICTT